MNLYTNSKWSESQLPAGPLGTGGAALRVLQFGYLCRTRKMTPSQHFFDVLYVKSTIVHSCGVGGQLSREKQQKNSNANMKTLQRLKEK